MPCGHVTVVCIRWHSAAVSSPASLTDQEWEQKERFHSPIRSEGSPIKKRLWGTCLPAETVVQLNHCCCTRGWRDPLPLTPRSLFVPQLDYHKILMSAIIPAAFFTEASDAALNVEMMEGSLSTCTRAHIIYMYMFFKLLRQLKCHWSVKK